MGIDVSRGESERIALRVRALVGADAEPGHGEPGMPAPQRPVRMWDRLAARVPVRVDPGRRSAVAVGIAVLLAAVVTGLWLAADRPRAVAVAATPPTPIGALVGPSSYVAGATGAASGDPPAPAVSSAAEVVVDVAGKVRRPGLYHLPAGARVDDAIIAAGGARHGVDLGSLNLAARLTDGEQIAVGEPGIAPGPPAAGGDGGALASAATSAAPVDLNTATSDQLETLPGVGPVTAQNILDWRSANGSFASVDQLRDVTGIGDVRFAQLRGLVTV